MANLQVKRVPDDLYAAAKARAASEGISLSELVIRLIKIETARPSMAEWLASVPRGEPIEVDIEALMDEVRSEFDDR